MIYDDLDQMVDEVAPFILEGLEAGEPVLVAELPEQVRALENALGADAARITFLDMVDVGRDPGRLIPAWRDFVARHRGVPVRGVGEPAWCGRRPGETEECRLHEAMLSMAFDSGPDFHLLCTYDATLLPEDVLVRAMRTHPNVTPLDRHEGYDGPQLREEQSGRRLSDPPWGAVEIPFGRADLTTLRGIVRRQAESARLAVDVRDDLELAVHELAYNSVRYGDGEGLFRSWVDNDSLVLEISGNGVISDPLFGRELAAAAGNEGLGIWLAHQLCDLLQVRSSQHGTTVRLHAWL